MNLANVNAESLSQELELEVPEMYVVLAKHSVMGTDESAMCEILGVDMNELLEVQRDPIYKAVRLQIGAMAAESSAQRVHGWDGIESLALEKLIARMEYEKDSDFLLKAATLANKAQRRGGSDMGVLDPSKAGKTAVVLTQRMVQKFTNQGETRETVRELSIHDGSMERVSFDDVDELLDVRNKVPLPQHNSHQTMTPSIEELDAEMERRS